MKIKRKEVEKKEEELEAEEVETEISPWRLGIALAMVILIGGALVWFGAQLADKALQKSKQVLGAQQTASNNVTVPSQKDVDEYIHHWQDHISPEDLQKLIASNSAVGRWVQKLEDVQASDKGVIDMICSVVCHNF